MQRQKDRMLLQAAAVSLRSVCRVMRYGRTVLVAVAYEEMFILGLNEGAATKRSSVADHEQQLQYPDDLLLLTRAVEVDAEFAVRVIADPIDDIRRYFLE